MTDPMKARPIRMTDDEWEKCKALGGAEWVRKQIARADVDKVSAKRAAQEAKLGDEKKRYLYTHAYQDGRVFYVGLGTKSRSRYYYNRSQEHLAALQEVGRSNVKVTLIELEPRVSPYWQEQKLIEKMREAGHPLCNKVAGRRKAGAQ